MSVTASARAVVGRFRCTRCGQRFKMKPSMYLACPSCGNFIEVFWEDWADCVRRYGWEFGIESTKGADDE